MHPTSSDESHKEEDKVREGTGQENPKVQVGVQGPEGES
jgi:hypothetical protein